ncbi:MAG: hypothetical protein ACJ72U_08730, partial [Nitrososphaeraceae archaeon]
VGYLTLNPEGSVHVLVVSLIEGIDVVADLFVKVSSCALAILTNKAFLSQVISNILCNIRKPRIRKAFILYAFKPSPIFVRDHLNNEFTEPPDLYHQINLKIRRR